MIEISPQQSWWSWWSTLNPRAPTCMFFSWAGKFCKVDNLQPANTGWRVVYDNCFVHSKSEISSLFSCRRWNRCLTRMCLSYCKMKIHWQKPSSWRFLCIIPSCQPCSTSRTITIETVPKHHALRFLPKAETYKNCTTSWTKTHHTWRHRKRLPVLLSGYVKTRLPHFFRTFPRKASHCTAWNWCQGLPQNVFCTSLSIRTANRFPVQHVQRPETSSPSPQCPERLYRITASNIKNLSSVFHAYMKNAAASFFSCLSEESLELYNFKLTSGLDHPGRRKSQPSFGTTSTSWTLKPEAWHLLIRSRVWIAAAPTFLLKRSLPPSPNILINFPIIGTTLSAASVAFCNCDSLACRKSESCLALHQSPNILNPFNDLTLIDLKPTYERRSQPLVNCKEIKGWVSFFLVDPIVLDDLC